MFCSRYQPRSLEDFDHNKDLVRRLSRFSSPESLINTIFYGPPSSGKNTVLEFVLRTVIGDNLVKRISTFKVDKSEVVYISSDRHIEIDFLETKEKDVKIVTGFVKEFSSADMIGGVGIVVFKNAHLISKQAQKALLRIIELSGNRARFILLGQELAKFMPALKSRFACVCVPGAKAEMVKTVLKKIAKEEGIKLTKKRLGEIVERSECRLRDSIHILEMSYLGITRYKAYKLERTDLVSGSLWKEINKSKPDIMKIRRAIYEIISKNISASYVIGKLVDMFIEKSPDHFATIIEEGAKYEHLMVQGDKTPFYIETFIATIVNTISKEPERSIHYF